MCLLVDSRREPMEADLEIIEAFRAMGLPHVVCATKVDKLTSKVRRHPCRTRYLNGNSRSVAR